VEEATTSAGGSNTRSYPGSQVIVMQPSDYQRREANSGTMSFD
jgi:hypothetical protein